MSADEQRLDYFIIRTDERLKAIEGKIDQLIGFRFMLIGGSAMVSALISLAVAVYFGK